MTNKPMLSVERELLERILDSIGFGEREELKAILDNQALESQYDGMTQAQAQAVSDDVDEILHGKPASEPWGVPVVCVELVENKIHGGMHIVKWDNLGKLKQGIHKLYAEQPEPAADHTQCEECKGWGYHENHHEGGGTECGECGGSGNASVAVFMPDVDELAQIIRNVDGSHTLGAGSLAEAILEEVARLNGVKP